MTFLSNDKQTDIIEAFDQTHRYMGGLINIDTAYSLLSNPFIRIRLGIIAQERTLETRDVPPFDFLLFYSVLVFKQVIDYGLVTSK